MSPAPFQNLIRFLDEDLVERYGNIDSALIGNIVGSKAQVLEGDLLNLKKTDKRVTVKKLLSPVPSTPIFICIGLNYADHANEANLQVPPNPVIFMKPADALGFPESDITIPKDASLLDYEGELCVIISRTGKDISEDEAYDYILGFTAGNDISSRYWQRPPYSGGQFCYAKSFDGFAPIGPTLLHSSFAPRGLGLEIQTTVNGQVRQKATTQDMLFSIEKIISHCSRGTTLRAGTIIMTGTPAGIAAKMPGSPWLKNDDVVEVEISHIGRLRNKIVSP